METNGGTNPRNDDDRSEIQLDHLVAMEMDDGTNRGGIDDRFGPS